MGELIQIFHPVFQLIGHVLIPDDRPGDELREQRHIGAKGNNTALYAGFFPIDVDHIGHDLEGIERDPDGEGDQRGRQVGEQGDTLQNAGHKTGVFEKSQQSQVNNDTGDQQNFSGPFLILVFVDQKPVYVVDHRRKDHHQDKNRLAPSIKYQIGGKQK